MLLRTGRRSLLIGVLHLEPHVRGELSSGGLVRYHGDSEISDSENERSPQGEQPPGVGNRMSLLPVYPRSTQQRR